MMYYKCKGCKFPIKMGVVYQVGDDYYHETCRPSYANEHWQYLIEHSMKEGNYTSEGFKSWLLRDWGYDEIGVNNRRRAKVLGLTEAQIREKLRGWKKPKCPSCNQYVMPWDNQAVVNDSILHQSCLQNYQPSIPDLLSEVR